MSYTGPTTTVYEKGLKSPGGDPIKKIETFNVRPRWLFVRVETEKGIVGWGGEHFRSPLRAATRY